MFAKIWNRLSLKPFGILALALSISSCSMLLVVQVEQPVTSRPNDACIDTFDEFAFSTPQIDGPEQKIIYPLNPWRKESHLSMVDTNHNYMVSLTRMNHGKMEIWVQPYAPSGIYDMGIREQSPYYVYTPDNDEWRKVSGNVNEDDIFVDQLYLDAHNRIWGRNAWSYKAGINNIGPLSYFDELSKTFKVDKSSSSIPNGIYYSPGDVTSFMKLDDIYLDQAGIFWIFVYKDAIYSYNPNTGTIIRHIAIRNLPDIHNVSYSSPANTFFLDAWDITDPIYLLKDMLYEYSIDSEELRMIPLPKKRWPNYHSILVDASGRLWLDSVGWLDPDGTWEEFNPLMDQFIRVNKTLSLWRYYQPPGIIYESSDGRLWFSIPRSDNWSTLRSGIAWYDPKKNIGCWFTSEGYGVLEDGNGVIWMMAGKDLYSYDLGIKR